MRGLVRLGVHNPVPMGLLMMVCLGAGLVASMSLRREFFPELAPDTAVVTLAYPGATPEEIEETLAIKVEDALWDLDEVEEIHTTLAEGGGGLMVRIREGVDPQRASDEIDRVIVALQDLPDQAERITVHLLEPRLPVIRMAVYGGADEALRKAAVRQVRDELLGLPGMGEVLIEGVRGDEVRVDVQQAALVRHGLSLPEIAETIRAAMAEVPAGTVRGASGNVQVRTMGVLERQHAIEQIEVRVDAQGRAVRLGDIARVQEGFVDEQLETRFDGQPAAFLTVFKVGRQDIVTMATMVRAYAAGRQGKPLEASTLDRLLDRPHVKAWRLGAAEARPLPVGIEVAALSDLARFVEGRLELLLRNGVSGALLVFGTLFLFLNWRAAWWVGVGLLTAVGGTLTVMLFADVTLNLMTMFGLIIVMGLLIDDAIVVAENIQRRHDGGEPAMRAALDGTLQVFWPVVTTVITSVVAFLPLAFVSGQMGDMMGALPWVVACALMMSLMETMLILPGHMGHSLAHKDRSATRRSRWGQHLHRLEQWRDQRLVQRWIPAYGRLLARLLGWRYVVVAVGLAVLIFSLGLVAGGRVVFTFMASDDSETLMVDLHLPIGTTLERTQMLVEAIEAAAGEQPETATVSAVIGQRSNIETGQADASASHIAQLFIELHPVELRDRPSSDVVAAIRQSLAELPALQEAERLSFSEVSGGPMGAAISIRIRGQDQEAMAACARDLKALLDDYPGTHDIIDDTATGQTELRLALRPGAAAMGFSASHLAWQMRGALFGIDAHVFAEREEDIDVRVRLEETARQSLARVEGMWVISPAGRAVPLGEVARIEEVASHVSLKRVDRQRAILVSADTDPGINPEAIVASLTRAVPGPDGTLLPSPLDELRSRYPMLQLSFAGRQEQMAKAFGSLPYGFLAAMAVIYVILAWLFASYLQPLVVMAVIPFGAVGMIWGHLLLGYDLTFLSLIGFVALSGIVINDSLILMDFYNQQRATGMPMRTALLDAGQARLRAIFLTTLTTVAGLTPLILETSFQARFLIPMAITLAGGLISASLMVLVMLPCFLMILDDGKRLTARLWAGGALPASEAEASPGVAS